MRNGLESLAGNPPARVLIHDAARPFASAALIDDVVAALDEAPGAIPAIPIRDTVKRGAAAGTIAETLDRSALWRAQTPQGFRFGLLKKAMNDAVEDGFVGTDEASVVERAGLPVAVVHGSQVNLKITQPGDIELAEFYLHQRTH